MDIKNKNLKLHIKKINSCYYLIMNDDFNWCIWHHDNDYIYVKNAYNAIQQAAFDSTTTIFNPGGHTYSMETFNQRIEIIKKTYKVHNSIRGLLEALEAGHYNAAPVDLVQGSPLQVEDLNLINLTIR